MMFWVAAHLKPRIRGSLCALPCRLLYADPEVSYLLFTFTTYYLSHYSVPSNVKRQ